MGKLKFRIIVLAGLLLSVLSFSPALVSALDCSNPQTIQEQIQCGACNASGNNCPTGNPSKTLGDTVASIINVLSVAVGVLAVIMIIIAGLRYVTSAGNPEAAKGARNTILYAVIGLIVVALAQIIVHFVLTNTTAATDNSSPPPSSSGSGPTIPHGAQ